MAFKGFARVDHKFSRFCDDLFVGFCDLYCHDFSTLNKIILWLLKGNGRLPKNVFDK